jgi:hypothetical protein
MDEWRVGASRRAEMLCDLVGEKDAHRCTEQHTHTHTHTIRMIAVVSCGGSMSGSMSVVGICKLVHFKGD